ncbi:aminoacyl-tRNA hydrolase [candidate division WOR-3 bacterium]|nr:aminoacyl-tRNA hydrolase [candidate division WOR-3 bacterium]
MIIFGLGNPGEKYLLNRHNLGFMVVDALAEHLRLRFRISGQALIAKGSYSGKKLWLVKPLSYMNLSGQVVKQVLSKHTDDFLVVVDDVDLEFSTIRLRKQGGTSGHNGLASISDCLDAEDFPRLRIGIGPRPEGFELSDYVLSNFTPDEFSELQEIIGRAADAVLLVITQGMDIAMNQIN